MGSLSCNSNDSEVSDEKTGQDSFKPSILEFGEASRISDQEISYLDGWGSTEAKNASVPESYRRWQPVTLKFMLDKHAKEFCWIAPNERLEPLGLSRGLTRTNSGPSSGTEVESENGECEWPLGGFVYRFETGAPQAHCFFPIIQALL